MAENVQWFKIRSWHIAAKTSRRGMIGSPCGRWAIADAAIFDDRPAGKTCESCLRIAGPK